MCGLTGFWTPAGMPEAEMAPLGRRMAETLRARGPDGEGVWHDAEAGLCLAHRRLAVIDLTPSGAQPMVSADGRFVIAYNGEIFNFRELAAELRRDGASCRGVNDTEVLLEACARWGARAAVERSIGMFAFALWDRRERRLTLARDRLGIKPLYWARCGATLLFGSQTKSFRPHPAWRPTLDVEALAAYFAKGYVPAPLSIWREARQLAPGTLVAFDARGEPEEQRFWDLREVAMRGLAAPRRPSTEADAEAEAELSALLADAVSRRLVADVPLGAFLSGGIDSSAVVAVMQAASARPVRTFTVGYGEAGFDESADAAAVARHLGTEHTTLIARPEDALAAVAELPDCYDEPFADSSALPTLLLARLTRRHVTVALSGDGGDEAFAGYNRYRYAAATAKLERLPAPIRRAVAAAIAAPPPGAWDAVAGLLPGALRPRHAGDKAAKLAGALGAGDLDAAYALLSSLWRTPPLAAAAPPPEEHGIDVADPVARLQFLDQAGYLPGDILAKVDRASMAASLEVRVPLLDHRLIEFAWRLPPHQKLRRGESKWLLRRVLERRVPRHLVARPKMGFAVPIERWLGRELRGFAEELLAPAALAAGGLLDPAPILARWRAHLAGRPATAELWSVLMFQLWRRSYGV